MLMLLCSQGRSGGLNQSSLAVAGPPGAEYQLGTSQLFSSDRQQPHKATENEFYYYARFDTAPLENKELFPKPLPEQVPFQVKNNNLNLCSNSRPTMPGICLLDVLLGQKLSIAKSYLGHLLVFHIPFCDTKFKLSSISAEHGGLIYMNCKKYMIMGIGKPQESLNSYNTIVNAFRELANLLRLLWTFR